MSERGIAVEIETHDDMGERIDNYDVGDEEGERSEVLRAGKEEQARISSNQYIGMKQMGENA